MDEPRRPSAEEMLARTSELTNAGYDQPPAGRGRLTVYLGAAPGVGKTVAMLREGHRLRARGVDVVCGFIETHGRAETAAEIGDLEVVSRRDIAHRGIVVEELDTDAILRRNPRVCLIDEIAHTNVPGSQREKRWQDVEVVRDHGIDVLATLNVQHLASVNDIVEAITGVRVRETVPDAVLEDPTIVHLIDLPPEELRQRLREGRIYPPERASKALVSFFRPGNLTALRELTLRRVAEGVEASLEQYMATHDIAGPWPATETVMACFGAGPLSNQVLRHAWRLARGLNATYLAVHGTRVPLERLNPEERRIIERDTELAVDLGAQVVIAEGDDIVAALLEVADRHNVTQIVIGHSTRSRWQELRGHSLVSELIRRARGYDIVVVADRDRDGGSQR